MSKARFSVIAAALAVLLGASGLVVLSSPAEEGSPRPAAPSPSAPLVRGARPAVPRAANPIPPVRPAARQEEEAVAAEVGAAARERTEPGAPPAPAARGGAILGRVLDPQRRAVAAARVCLSHPRGELEVATDAAGAFAFAFLPGGHYRLGAFHPDFAPAVARAEGFRVDLADGATERVELVLEPGVEVEGVVLAADGSGPVGGARVTLVRELHGRFLTVLTAPDGTFRFAHFPLLPAGERPFPIEATADGFAPGYAALEPRSAGERHRLEIRLDRGAAVHGVVTDSDGRPLEGVSVRCRFRYRYVKEMSEITGRTDNLGAYRIDHLPRGLALQVWAFREGHRPTYLNVVLSEAQRDKMLRPLRLARAEG
ncbi:MAG: carboxypeptidase regulatory-like domain-containing protein [Planctomycetes bacterium]|nr:carboxypeptidase regulatory-like domain-containing protein [Planctomycetota bacterium]